MLEEIQKLPEWEKILSEINNSSEKPHGRSLNLIQAARFPVTAALCQNRVQPVLYLTDREPRALLAFDEIGYWSVDCSRLYFPAPEPIFYEQASWGQSAVHDRVQVLAGLIPYLIPGMKKPEKPPLIVAPIRAVMTRSLDRRSFLKSVKTLRTGQEISLTDLSSQWVHAGYASVDIVLESGQFSKRGGLLDIWPPSEKNPVRIDFFGDEIDTIQHFYPETQRNFEKIDKVVITPAREVLTDSADKLGIDINPDNQPEFYIPYLYPNPSCLLDFLPSGTLVLMDDENQIQYSAEDIEQQAEDLRRQSLLEGTLPPDYSVPYLSFSEISDQLNQFAWINLGISGEKPDASFADHFVPSEHFAGLLPNFMNFLQNQYQKHEPVTVISRQAKRLQDLWDKYGAAPGDPFAPRIQEGSIAEGFMLTDSGKNQLVLDTDSEIFGWERPIPRKAGHQITETPEKYFTDLKAGDYVVHIDYGIGRYTGLVKRSIDGITKDFLCVEYAQGDQLFIPVHQADRLTNYVGPDGQAPELTRLGTQDWLNTKQHVRADVLDMANDLLDLYAKRQAKPGYAYSPDTSWQADMEGAFPFEETPDQKLAIQKVKEDMESPHPMDRLICGDVGFGKTEIALRAAFKAVCNDKQVAILVPTTVLAQQHYETFRKRFAAYPFTVEMLSRFRSPKEQTRIIKKLETGDINVIIGTHRLISKDVKFKDLGLVVIDEEQRFGVAQKEYLKKLRTEVDILTMTATPIPRTLNMALNGIRDISIINTPPYDRVPIITHIGPYSDKLIRQAVLREMERGGQTFFVHNRVQSIYEVQKNLQELIPEARIGVAHGQLPEKELSIVMESFYEKEIDLLLCTSIIESGLDVPNANTLIVDRADTFGLAQLYQIRGRVGRSSNRAYAYFFRQANHMPTEDGMERLEVIAENTHFGAGYSIAMRDLEMRGAGEMLGTRQHGSIASVGFNLYSRMLAQAVRNLRDVKGINVKDEDIGITKEMAYIFDPIAVELPLDIAIPETYINDPKTRIKLYRRMASVHDEADLDALKDEFTDRFGPLPEVVKNLFFQILIKIHAERIGLSGVMKDGNSIVLRFPPLPAGYSDRNLPDIEKGIRSGKNAYWLPNIDLSQTDWEKDLIEDLQKIEAVVHRNEL